MGFNPVNIRNKRAYFEYEILEELTAGMVLTGTEIKSLREGKGSLNEAFCAISEGEAFVRNLFIPEYSLGTYANHSPRRQRKLLLNRKEINKWEHKVKEKGLTIVPLKLYLNEKGLAKLQIGLAKGKKMYDKRNSLKEKDVQRDLERARKGE